MKKSYTGGSSMSNGNYLPKQKVAQSKKTKAWYKRHLEYADRFISYSANINSSYENMLENYDLRVNKLDRSKYEKFINPDGIADDKFPAEFKHIGIGNAKINLLLGDYTKIDKHFRASISNNDSIGISAKSEEHDEELMKRLDALIKKQDLPEDKLEKELGKLQEWSKYGFQAIGEKTANAILKKEFTEKNYEFLFTRTFEDLLVSGNQIVLVDIIGKEPIIERIDPRNVHTLGTSDSLFMHDQDVITIVEYHSIGRVHDKYWDELSDSDVSKLEQTSHIGARKYNPRDSGNVDVPVILPSGSQDVEESLQMITIPQFRNSLSNTGSRNSKGEVRVLTMFWKSRRKIGELSYFDEDTGTQMTAYVNEHYVADEAIGESIKWLWINEWQRATMIAEDIMVKYGPVEHSSKALTNISYGLPPIIGLTTSTNSYQVQSFMDIIKPFDIAYDIGFWKREIEVAAYKGRATAINASMIPSDWDPQQWLHMAAIDKTMFLNPHEEVLKGPNMGKAAGSYSTFITQPVDLGSDAQSINLLTEYLTNIEYTMGKISGVHGAREGEIGERTAVRNAQSEMEQFSKITEKWFSIDNEFRRLVIKKFLEVCKIAYAKTPERGMYLLNEVGQEFIQMSKNFPFYEYDIHIPGSRSSKMFEELKELAHAALQNGQARIDHVMRITLTESAAERIQILKDASKEIAEQQSEQAQREMEANQALMEATHQLEREKMETDITVAQIQAEAKDRDSIRRNAEQEEQIEEPEDNSLDYEKLNMTAKQHEDKIALDKEKLAETKRSNQANERIKKTQANKRPATAK